MAYNVALHELRGDKLVALNEAVTEFQKEFHFIMKSKGFDRKVSKQSALYNWAYTKGTRRIAIDGWHGTGTPGTNRFYGYAKSFFDLYDNASKDYRAVVHAESSGPAGSMDKLFDGQLQAMKKALEYARNL